MRRGAKKVERSRGEISVAAVMSLQFPKVVKYYAEDLWRNEHLALITTDFRVMHRPQAQG